MNDTSLKQCLKWATVPFENGMTYRNNSVSIRKTAQLKEKDFGCSIINKSTGNWSSILGEKLVFNVLQRLEKNPRKPIIKNNYCPDLETDDYIYEIKTRNWTTSGTAGEKVLGTMYKYSDIPLIYKKPLKIVCVAYQEYELSNGTTKIFGDVSDSKKLFLKLANDLNINYVKFSDLISELPSFLLPDS